MFALVVLGVEGNDAGFLTGVVNILPVHPRLQKEREREEEKKKERLREMENGSPVKLNKNIKPHKYRTQKINNEKKKIRQQK